MTETRFVVLTCFVLATIVLCVAYMRVHREVLEANARRRPSNPNVLEMLLPAVVAGAAGCLTNVALKGVGVLLRSGWSFLDILPWVLLTALSALTQLNYVSRGLKFYQQTLFIPVYQSMLVLLSTVVGMVFYQEYRQIRHIDTYAFAFGVAGIVGGISCFAFRFSDDTRDSSRSFGEFPNFKG